MNKCDQAFAQYSGDDLVKMVASLGFENVRFARSGDTLRMAYENNIYRWNVRGWIVILDTISDHVDPGTGICLITLNNGIPVFETFVRAEDWKSARNGDLTKEEIDKKIVLTNLTTKEWKELKKLGKSNSSLFKFDFIIYPQIYIQNNYFDYIYEIQFNIAPAVEFSLWNGGKFTGQVIFPVYNNPHLDDEGDYIRPGVITVSQDFRLPGQIFGKVSAGKFEADRYGIDLGLSHPFKNPHFALGLNIGITGWTYFDNGVLTLGKDFTPNWKLTGSYYYSRFDLQFDFTAGRYLYNESQSYVTGFPVFNPDWWFSSGGDYGARLDIVRYFGETAIGIWGGYSGGEPNGGFHFTVPFPPGKRSRKHHVRVLPPEYFDWEYRAVHVKPQGNYYDASPDVNRSGNFFNLIYIKNSLY